MSATITTPAELDALPDYTLLLDRSNVPLRRMAWGWTTWNAREAIPAGIVIAGGAPLTVLYRPDAEPAPVTITAERVGEAWESVNDTRLSPSDRDHLHAMLAASGIEVSR